MARGANTIEIQERDLALLRGLFESRLMTIDHAAALHFDGKREMAKKRLQKLKAAGLISERPRNASEPSVLYLAADGLTLLQDRGLLSDFPSLGRAALLKRAQVSDMTVSHELEVMSVKAAFVAAIRATGRYEIVELSTWPLLNQFTVNRSVIDPQETGDITVKPDGFMRIHETGSEGELFEHAFYLEVDRGTETLQTLVNKALGYREFYKSGGFAERSGGKRSDFQQFPFRVLLILHSVDRLTNVAQALLAAKPPIRRMVWLTTIQEAQAGPLDAIWRAPQDFLHTPIAALRRLFD